MNQKFVKRAILVAGSMAAISNAETTCWISNLPPSFSIQLGGPVSSATETVVARWENFNALGVTTKCFYDNGTSSVTAPSLNNGGLQIYVSSTSPHYKAFLSQLQFAKANALQLDVQVPLLFSSSLGWQFINLIAK